jgi:uncharacterized protein involved in tolerance to divalent cations
MEIKMNNKEFIQFFDRHSSNNCLTKAEIIMLLVEEFEDYNEVCKLLKNLHSYVLQCEKNVPINHSSNGYV